jgi:hypothetical protein
MKGSQSSIIQEELAQLALADRKRKHLLFDIPLTSPSIRTDLNIRYGSRPTNQQTQPNHSRFLNQSR